MTYKIINGNCLDVMPKLSGVDAIITDPPYLDGDFSGMLPMLLSACKRLVVTPGKLESFNWIRNTTPTYEYAWESRSQSMGGRACMHISWEPILSYGFPLRPLGTDLLKFPIGQTDQVNGHVWPKPLYLMRKLVRHWSNVGDTILDPFMGSGTTGVAAILEGRNFIGIEIDINYCMIAQRRIADAAAQPRLLDVEPIAQQGELHVMA